MRYSSGTVPTARGYTGQYADAASGLDYYNARYYDPALGQFTSADTKQGPNRYAYVADNPETLTDPTGHRYTCFNNECGSSGSGSTGTGSGHGGGGGGNGSGGCRTDGGCGCYSSCGGGGHQGGGHGNDPFDQSLQDGAVGGMIAYARRIAADAKDYYNTPTQVVSGYTRANGTEVASYMRRPAGNAGFAAEAGDAASKLRMAGRVLFWAAAITDAVGAGIDFYNADQGDPERGEKAVVAGIMHSVIATGTAVVFVAAVSAIPVIGETGIAQVAAGELGAWVGGQIANSVVTQDNVTQVTNADLRPRM